MSLLQHLDTFLFTFMYLKSIPQNSQEKICAGVSFVIKLEVWKSANSLNTESGTSAFLSTFRKILGFYYKRKRKLFYYEGTSSQTLKISELVNRVISQVLLFCCLWKYLNRQKHVQSREKRNVSGMLFGCPYD